MRQHSAERVFAEIEDSLSLANIDYLYFADDEVLSDKARAKELSPVPSSPQASLSCRVLRQAFCRPRAARGRSLSESGQRQRHLNTIKCLLCSSDAHVAFADLPGYVEGTVFRIMHCPSCRTAFALPRIDSSLVYDAIYKNAPRCRGYARYAYYAERVSQERDPIEYLASREEQYWAIREALDAWRKTGPRNNKVLEIGSGYGYLTYALRTCGFDVAGVDLSQAAVSDASRRYGHHFLCADASQLLSASPDAYGAIIMSEVLEHLPDPVATVASIARSLAPGGRLILTTPNRSVYADDVVWTTELPPLHWWWFGEDSIGYLAGRCGLALAFTDFSGYYLQYPRSSPIKHGQTADELRRRPPAPFVTQDGRLLQKDLAYVGATVRMKSAVLAGLRHAGLLAHVRRLQLRVKGKKPFQDGRTWVLCATLTRSA